MFIFQYFSKQKENISPLSGGNDRATPDGNEAMVCSSAETNFSRKCKLLLVGLAD